MVVNRLVDERNRNIKRKRDSNKKLKWKINMYSR